MAEVNILCECSESKIQLPIWEQSVQMPAPSKLGVSHMMTTDIAQGALLSIARVLTQASSDGFLAAPWESVTQQIYKL